MNRLTIIILIPLAASSTAWAANTKLARSKLDFHMGDIRSAHVRLWRLLKSDTRSKQRQLSNAERAEVRRLLGSSTYLLTGDVAKSRLAFRKSLEFSRRKPLANFEKRDQQVEAIYEKATKGRRSRYTGRVPRPVDVKMAITDLVENRPIGRALVSVQDSYGPFTWAGEPIKLAPGKHRIRIEAPGYKPTQVLWRVNHKKEGRFIQVNLVPLNIFKSR